jgi:hypothetical protein
MREDWTQIEVEAIVADYFEMLTKELKGETYSKTKHNNNLQLLIKRSRGSIEFKHANISAILIENGHVPIDGYKPRSNYQLLLREVVKDRLHNSIEVDLLTSEVVNKPVIIKPERIDFSKFLVDVPSEIMKVNEQVKTPFNRNTRKPNYLEIEARNQSLGLHGEQLILEFEHQRLWECGQKRLAEKIDHISQTKGDSIGYDIKSFESSGKPRRIEVKTTRLGPLTPFFASKNEVETSFDFEAEYHLYRLFKFEKNPKLFIVRGSLAENFQLEAINYRVRLA